MTTEELTRVAEHMALVAAKAFAAGYEAGALAVGGVDVSYDREARRVEAHLYAASGFAPADVAPYIT